MTRVLGIDHGTRRVGLALSDTLRVAANPLLVIPRLGAIDRIMEVIAEYEVAEVVIGLPSRLRGGEGESAEAARNFAEELERSSGLPIHLVDERFTSKIAEKTMLEAGARRRTRRENVDKVAATVILQGVPRSSQLTIPSHDFLFSPPVPLVPGSTRPRCHRLRGGGCRHRFGPPGRWHRR